MSDEVKITTETKEEHKCFCQSKGVRKFLVIALGTFVGVYAALCLFTALHRPPMPPQGFGPGFGAPMPPAMQCPCRYHHMHKFNKAFRGDRGDFRKFEKGDKHPAPFEARKDFDDKD